MLLGTASSGGGNGLLTSLVGYWKLDGDATDASGNGLNGTRNERQLGVGHHQPRRELSGSANVDLTGNAALKAQQMSVAGWFGWGAFTADNRWRPPTAPAASLSLSYDNGTGVADGT